jgi:hypothetical protein
MTIHTQPIQDLANTASTQFSLAIDLKHRCKYKKAFEYFKLAARKYEELANIKENSAEKRIHYLEMQKECLKSMLNDAFNYNLTLWANIMLKLKKIKSIKIADYLN